MSSFDLLALPVEVALVAGPRTDLFVDPGTGEATVSASRVLGSPGDGDFQLSARVEAALAETYDAGTLVVWGDQTTWAKLALEFSPQHEPMVVSVVTRGRSDDANGPTVAGAAIWLRVSRIGQAYAFHSSHDGSRWDLVRHFTLGAVNGHAVGLLVQSPTGEGCRAVFRDLVFSPTSLADLRNGD